MFVREDLVTELEKNFTINGPLTMGIEDNKDSISIARTMYDYYMSDINFDAHSSQFTQVWIPRMAAAPVLNVSHFSLVSFICSMKEEQYSNAMTPVNS